MCPENIWVMYIFAKTGIKSKEVFPSTTWKLRMEIRNIEIEFAYNPITQNAEEGEDPQVQNYPKLHNKILSQAIKKET